MNAPPPALKITQTLVAALLGGLLTVSTIMTIVPGRGSAADPRLLKILLGAGGAILVGGQIAALMIRREHVAKASQAVKGETDAEGRDAACLPYFQVATILRAALAEGPGLLGAVTVLLTGSQYGLVLVGAAAAVLLVTFPTTDRFGRFVDEASGVRTH